MKANKVFAITTSVVLSMAAIALSAANSAMAQGFPDMHGQEHIDRGTMDRNRRSRGQTRTLWGNDSENNTSQAARTLITRRTGDDPILLFVGIDIREDGSVVPNGQEEQGLVYLEPGLEITPTGHSVGNRVAPVEVNSTGQRGWIFMSQLEVVD